MDTQPMNELDQTDFTELDLCYDDLSLVVLCHDYLSQFSQIEISKKGGVIYLNSKEELVTIDLKRRVTSSDDTTIQELVQKL